ncbi:MAG: electron transfer flavoprotein subunit alpha [Flavobacteriaceae bacterium]|nr:electron transfer flavoprotein subunit alpha [Flavobacteriaceae bacterium]|tara:strand:- start:10456 stop:11412 length:957 start_codon:yes stop_codon:yes gene_type:complete
MSVLVYIESENGLFKKTALEVASYGRALANKMKCSLNAVVFNSNNNPILGDYGVDRIINIETEQEFIAEIYADYLKQVAIKENSQVVILSNSANCKYLAPFLSVGLKAGYVPNVVKLPVTVSPFLVKRSAFTNKALLETEILTDIKIIGLSNNAFGLVKEPTESSSEDFSPEIKTSKIEIKGVDKVKDKVSIADADIVVSAGRGLKGPENWNMIEALANVLGAATACSKPVSDLGWRPHSEHVGQTGKPVASNLYIAIGISGAIQHLAGINSSKIKVVINSDPEAPFFKSADYGIVGDAFDIVPKLTEKLKAFKQQNS